MSFSGSNSAAKFSSGAPPTPSNGYAAAPSNGALPSSSLNSPKTPDITATTVIDLNDDQEQQVIKYARMAQVALTNQYSLRWNMERIDRAYMRESDWTPDQIKSRIANRGFDASKMQNVTVPVVMPQVQAALGYLVNVFLTGYPIFGVTSDPVNENAALQMETIIGENATTTGWAKELTMFFRDGLKYNLCAIECDWCQRNTWTIDTDPLKANGAAPKKVLWQGNKLKRMDLYNTFWDPRVHPSEMHSQGEYVGYTEMYSRSRFKKFMNDLYNKVPAKNIIKALNSSSIQGAIGANTTAPFGYYQPLLNPYPFFQRQAGFDWMAWATDSVGIKSANGMSRTTLYSVSVFYARIIPDDFGLKVPERNTPQVWKFTIVNGQVVLSAERMTNVHGYIPIFFCQPQEDGLDYQTKSFASNVTDMQDVATAMWNGYIASKRRLVGDRVLYDPSRIREKDINSINPAAKIPVRPSAYGRPLNEAVYQFPFRDEMTESLVQGSAAVIQFANLINGQNPAQQGQFVKGNKTKHEYDDIMGHGNAANQMMAMSFEYSTFVPLKEVIKLNILQYQPETVIYNPEKGVGVNVQPVDIRKAQVHFKVSDGLIPADEITGEDMMQTVLQQFATSPTFAAGFNLPPMLVYMLKTQGLDLTPFAKTPAQLQYEQALSAWQSAAQQAAKAGTAFSTPQPQPSPQLQQEMQAAQQNGGYQPSVTADALDATQGRQPQ